MLRESQLPELCTALLLSPFFGKPVLTFPFFFLNQAALLCTQQHRARTDRNACHELSPSGSAGVGEREFHLTGEEKEAGKDIFFPFFFPRMFRAEIGLRHRCPYSAACFLRKTLLSSALQMRVEIFSKRGEFLSDLPLFQLHLWSLVPR